MNQYGKSIIVFVLFFCLQICFSVQSILWGAEPVSKQANIPLKWEDCAGAFPEFFKNTQKKDFLNNKAGNQWSLLFSWTSSSSYFYYIIFI